MKIECPHCRLKGKVNELELPETGRELECPRCKKSFHVDKPKTSAGGQDLMNICPACQYSTFTEDMFAVCPKCGMDGSTYREKMRKQQEKEQIQRDHEALTRSHRNPDLVTSIDVEVEPEKPPVPQIIRNTGVACMAVGGLLLFYGISGLKNYYGKDWQAILSGPFVEPVSKTAIFFRIGFQPWLVTFFGGYFLAAAALFLTQRTSRAWKDLVQSAQCGIVVGIVYELADFVNWIRISSSSPSFSYILTGLMNAFFWAAIWVAPAFALIWFLRSDRLLSELPGEDQS